MENYFRTIRPLKFAGLKELKILKTIATLAERQKNILKYSISCLD